MGDSSVANPDGIAVANPAPGRATWGGGPIQPRAQELAEKPILTPADVQEALKLLLARA